MKKIVLGVTLLATMVACNKKTEYAVIAGKLATPNGALALYTDGELVKDIVVNADGTFRDTIREMQQNQYNLVDKTQRASIPLYLKDGTNLNIEVQTNLQESKITGTDAELTNFLISSQKDLATKLGMQVYMQNPTEFKASVKTIFEDIKKDVEGRKLDKEFTENRKKWADYTFLELLSQYPDAHQYVTQSSEPVQLPEDFFAEKKGLNFDNAEDFKIGAYKRLVFAEFFDNIKDPNNEKEIQGLFDRISALKSENIKAGLAKELISFLTPKTTTKELIYNFVSKNIKDEKVKAEAKTQYEKVQKLAVGSPAPTFNYENYNGGTTKLEDLRGKLVYIDVWATWCGPCRAEIPFLLALEKEFHGKNVEFVSISVDEDKAKWKQFVEQQGLKGVQLFADKAWDSQFVQDCLIQGIPRFILIDKEGKIIDIDAPRPSSVEIKEIITKLL